MTDATDAPRGRLIAAFLAVYIIWGSTYLAIRFAVETIPPFLMLAARFLTSGAMLYAFARARHSPRPTRRQWAATAVIGALLLLGGNGSVAWAEQRVPSGVAALLVAVVPLWMVVIDWVRPGGERPSRAVSGGIVLGLIGVALLIGPAALSGQGSADLIGAAVLIAGSLSWAAGSIYTRHADVPATPILTTGMQMLTGGALLLAAGLASGEARGFHPSMVSGRSAGGLLFLITFGSLIGFTAYTYILQNSTAARVSTYAYVNPVVAVVLGWAFANEAITPRMLAAAAVIVGAVVLITMGRPVRPAPAFATATPADADG